VQILTIHRSKGLEFPVVMCPFLWAPGWSPREAEPVFFHDPNRGDRRTIDVGLEWPGWDAHQRQHHIEERGEDLRLLYVALTRARHQAVLWWAGAWDSQHSPLGRLLLSKDEHGNVSPDGPRSVPQDTAVMERLQQLRQEARGCVSITRSTLGAPRTWSPPLAQPAELHAAVFDRVLDLRWRRTSYSDITWGAHDPLVGSEPEERSLSDEPEAPTPVPEGPEPGTRDPALSLRSPMGEMPVGVRFGTFVHRVFEATDFAAEDLDAELSAQVELAVGRRGLELEDRPAVIAGLRAAIETPLGETIGEMSLRDVVRADRLDELGFELPLVGGDDPSGRLTLAAIAGVLREHLPGDDPLAGYAGRLADPALRASVRGFLTGSIDLVLRLDGPRFAVVDYKTNWLGTEGAPLVLGHYAPAALTAEMSRAHYGLQALLYTVALHRYLRWRLPGYDPDRQLAGVLYLFLRGMAGADTPRVDGARCGVFAWRPRAALVNALSDVLDGESP
jgi:exodeoxyribonuclease V beta subunit